MTWLSITIAGILTYFTRMTMIALVRRDLLGEKIKAVLAYVPSAVFPAIIFPAIFLDNAGSILIEDNPKILAAIIATGIEAIKAPKKGINTEKPTKTDSKAVYCNPNKLNIIAAAKPTIIISIDLPLT